MESKMRIGMLCGGTKAPPYHDLPAVHAKYMTLTLESANGNTNAYRLMYKK